MIITSNNDLINTIFTRGATNAAQRRLKTQTVTIQCEISMHIAQYTADLGNFVSLFNFSMCSMSSIYPKR